MKGWNLIAAVAKDGGIGREGQLLFRLPEDLHRFKALTMGGTLVMGRATLDSLPGGRPLPGRRNVVLTRDESFRREGVEAVHSVEQLLSLLNGVVPVWVIGGASVYEQLLPLCEALYLTEVDAVVPADRFLRWNEEEWTITDRSEWMQEGEVRYRFVERVRNS